MSAPPLDPRLAPHLERVGAYTRFACRRAARFALRLQAEELTPEHLLASLFEDEDCSATRLVLHAFADPESLAVELIALCPGIMVVSSGRSLPFSTLSVEVLERARAAAARSGAGEVGTEDVLRTALSEMPAELAEPLLGEIGEAAAPAVSGDGSDESGVPAEGPLFRHFSPAARRALGAAARAAGELERSAIAPAHLVLGCLESDAELRERAATSVARARLLLAGRDADESEPRNRPLPADPRLMRLVESLPSGAATVEILGYLLHHGSEELRALLTRQKITPALYERSAGAFGDPAPPSE